MRIVMTSNVFLNEKDTRANHLLGLFNQLSQLAEVYLFVPKDDKTKYDPHILYISWIDGFYPLRIIAYEITMFIKLFLLYVNIKFDAIYHRQSGLNISPLIISKIFKVPFFVEVNGLLVSQFKMTTDFYKISKFQLIIGKISEKINYKFSTKIITVAEGIKDGIIKLYNIPSDKVIVIQNGADTNLFKPISKKNLTLDFKFNLDYKYVGFVGSFAPWHGVEHLVKSASLVLSEYPGMKYVLVGNGGLKDKIYKMVFDLGLQDNFIFVDRVSHDEVPKYISLFDICIIFKDKSIPGSPLKLAEYMACGKPVIATASEDFEFLNEINAGILVDPINSEEVCHAIVSLLKNDSLRHSMGNNGRRYVVANRSWKNNARIIYDEFLLYT